MNADIAHRIGVIAAVGALVSGAPAASPPSGTDPSGAQHVPTALLTSASPFDGPFTIASGEFAGDTLTPHDFTVDGFYGPAVGQPGQPDTFQGTETFTVTDADGNPLGEFDAFVSHSVGSGNPNIEILVNPNGGATDTSPIPAGSVFNFGWNGSGTVTNSYSDIAGPGVGSTDYAGGTATNGSIIGWLFNPDYSAHLLAQGALVGDDDFALPNGDHIVAVPNTEDITAITNTSPYAAAVQGVGTFEIVRADGTVVGTFQGNTISTADIVGGHSFEVEVLGDQTMGDPAAGPQTVATAADLGSGANQLPTDGSMFNMLYLFSPNAYNDYVDYVGTGPGGSDEVSQLWNLFGLTWWTNPTFDAAKNMTDGGNLFDSLHTPYGDITPEGTLTVTAVNGIPNGGLSGNNSDVLGHQEFSLNGQDFWADVSDYANGNGTTAESLYLDPSLNPGGLPEGLTPGSEIDFTDGGWWQTVQIASDPLDGGEDVSQYLSIPFLGGAWTELDPATDGWLGWLGITF